MPGQIVIPPNKKVNGKFYVIQPPPDDVFAYDFHHFNSKQIKLMRKKLKHISEQDLSVQKIFDLYGIYAFDQMKISEKIPDHYSEEAKVEVIIENHCASHEYSQKFHIIYKSDYLNSENYISCVNDTHEFNRVMKLEGVSEALAAIYKARWFK